MAEAATDRRGAAGVLLWYIGEKGENQQEQIMLIRKPSPVIGIVVGAGFAAYHAGQSLHFVTPSPIQVIGIATASSTASVTGLGLFHSMTTFAPLEPPPPIVPPHQKFEQS